MDPFVEVCWGNFLVWFSCHLARATFRHTQGQQQLIPGTCPSYFQKHPTQSTAAVQQQPREPHRGSYILLCTNVCLLFGHLHSFLRRPWVFSLHLGCGGRRGPACTPTTGLVWVPGGLRGSCFGRSKSRNLASSRGVAFRGARAEQDNGKPTFLLFFAPLL